MQVLRLINFICCILWIGLATNNVQSFVINKPDDFDRPQKEYTREWAAKISDPLVADLIAIETGFVNRGLIKPFHDIYLFENLNVPHRGKRSAQQHTERLVNHEKVLKIEIGKKISIIYISSL